MPGLKMTEIISSLPRNFYASKCRQVSNFQINFIRGKDSAI